MVTNGNMKNVVRLLFLLLMLYEWLNFFGVLPFEPEFAWPGLLATLIVAWFALEMLDLFYRTGKIESLRAETWFLAFLAVAIDAIGDLHHFYDRWLWYDQVAHFLGTGAVMIALFDVVRAVVDSEKSSATKFVQGLLAYGFSITLASLFEVEEYLEDVFTGSDRLGSGFDTANDMLMNVFGATAVFSLLLFTGKLRERPSM